MGVYGEEFATLFFCCCVIVLIFETLEMFGEKECQKLVDKIIPVRRCELVPLISRK